MKKQIVRKSHLASGGPFMQLIRLGAGWLYGVGLGLRCVVASFSGIGLFLKFSCIAALAVSSFAARGKGAELEKHLFILSGQSNMQGLDPNLSFTPAVEAAFGKGNVTVVKDALGGQPIRRWFKKWKPAVGYDPAETGYPFYKGGQKPGDLYDRLMAAVEAETKGCHYTTVTFVWMQGERDAKESHGEVYATSLKGLIDQLSQDLGREDINVVIGRLSDFDMANAKYPHWTRIRDVQVEVASADPRIEWIDTDDLNDGKNGKGKDIEDDLHYSVDGYRLLGSRFAEKAIDLIRSREKPKLGAGQVMSPAEIWEGYDPREEPLDEEILDTWEADGVTYKEVYFNGERFDGKQVRIYGIYAAPAEGENLPALLHIHGGGQTVNEDWLKEFSGRGYAILTINWGGKWPNREKVTQWHEVSNGNHRERVGRQVTEPSPRSDAYYLWTQASMRALTYLESQAEVDPSRMGAFGISMGGTIMWNLAFDPRIKAGCAIYGAGWNSFSHKDPKYAIDHPGYTPTQNELRWRASLAPEASAPYVRFPMLFLSSSNDRHGYMDRAEDSLALMPADVPRAWALTPRFRHHIGADFIHTLPAWMDVHLKGEGSWPENPDAKMSVGADGGPIFVLKPDRGQEVKKVEVFYSLETPFAVNRHWRHAKSSGRGDAYVAATPVMNAGEYLFAFANVTYRSGLVVSSPLQAVIPETIGAVATIRKPSRVFYDGAEGVGDWTHASTGTDPIPARAKHRLSAAVGPGGLPALAVDRVGPMSYAPSDPEFRAPKGAALQFDIKTEQGEAFALKLHKNYWVSDFETYSCEVELEGSDEWQTVRLAGDRFLEEKTGLPLGDTINEVGVLEFSMPKGTAWKDSNALFRNFRWIGGEYVPQVHAYRNENDNTGGLITSSDDAAKLQDHEP